MEQQNEEDFIESDPVLLALQNVNPAANVESDPSDKKTKAACEILVEFLDVAIHQILYARKLYPEEIFLQRKKYSIPVYVSSHPGLNTYVSSSLSSLTNLLRENKVSYISVLVKDGVKQIENYLFEIKLLQEVLNEEQDLIELEQSLRSFILKILSSASSQGELPQSSSFEMLVGCNSNCEIDLNITDDEHATKWASVDPADFSSPFAPKALIPIKALTNSSILNIQLVLEKIGEEPEEAS